MSKLDLWTGYIPTIPFDVRYVFEQQTCDYFKFLDVKNRLLDVKIRLVDRVYTSCSAHITDLAVFPYLLWQKKLLCEKSFQATKLASQMQLSWFRIR